MKCLGTLQNLLKALPDNQLGGHPQGHAEDGTTKTSMDAQERTNQSCEKDPDSETVTFNLFAISHSNSSDGKAQKAFFISPVPT